LSDFTNNKHLDQEEKREYLLVMRDQEGEEDIVGKLSEANYGCLLMTDQGNYLTLFQRGPSYTLKY